ncbi:MAG: hypothetical protein M1819_004755 [Sarea resinae]|nr:MAG: hypothetical protein M1819_004755 [Sarea resinae]
MVSPENESTEDRSHGDRDSDGDANSGIAPRGNPENETSKDITQHDGGVKLSVEPHGNTNRENPRDRAHQDRERDMGPGLRPNDIPRNNSSGGRAHDSRYVSPYFKPRGYPIGPMPCSPNPALNSYHQERDQTVSPRDVQRNREEGVRDVGNLHSSTQRLPIRPPPAGLLPPKWLREHPLPAAAVPQPRNPMQPSIIDIDVRALEKFDFVEDGEGQYLCNQSAHSQAMSPGYAGPGNDPCSSVKQTLTITRTRWSAKIEEKEKVILTVGPESKEEGSAAFRWIHFQSDNPSWKDLERIAYLAPGLRESEKSLILRILNKTRRDSTKSFVHGSYLEPNASCYRGVDLQTEGSGISATFLCLPYFSCRPPTSYSFKKGDRIYPVRALLQSRYRLESTQQREKKQAICSLENLSQSEIIHVPQLWSLVVDNHTIITCGPMKRSELCVDSINLESHGEPSVCLQGPRENKTKFFIPLAKCRTWLKLSRILEDIMGTLIEDCDVKTEYGDLTPSLWYELIGKHRTDNINMTLVSRGGRKRSERRGQTAHGSEEPFLDPYSSFWDMSRKTCIPSCVPSPVPIRDLNTKIFSDMVDENRSSSELSRHSTLSQPKQDGSLMFGKENRQEPTVPNKAAPTSSQPSDAESIEHQTADRTWTLYEEDDRRHSRRRARETSAEQFNILPGYRERVRSPNDRHQETFKKIPGRKDRSQTQRLGISERYFEEILYSLGDIVFPPSAFGIHRRHRYAGVPEEVEHKKSGEPEHQEPSGTPWTTSPWTWPTSKRSKRTNHPRPKSNLADEREGPIPIDPSSEDVDPPNKPSSPKVVSSEDHRSFSETLRGPVPMTEDGETVHVVQSYPVECSQWGNKRELSGLLSFSFEQNEKAEGLQSIHGTKYYTKETETKAYGLRILLYLKHTHDNLSRTSDTIQQKLYCMMEPRSAKAVERALSKLEEEVQANHQAIVEPDTQLALKREIVGEAQRLLEFFVPNRCVTDVIKKYWGGIHILISVSETAEANIGSLEANQFFLDHLKSLRIIAEAFRKEVSSDDSEFLLQHHICPALDQAFRALVMFSVLGADLVLNGCPSTILVPDKPSKQYCQLRDCAVAYEGYLRTAKKQIADMDDRDYREEADFAALGATDVLALCMNNVLAECSKSFDLVDIYSEYMSKLRVRVREHPTVQVYDDITLLEEQLNIILHTLSGQNQVIHQTRDIIQNISQLKQRSKLVTRVFDRMQHEDLPQKIAEIEELRDQATTVSKEARQSISLRAETNDKAILVFTIVTIIFLPLSFVTSYLGMNTADIRSMNNSQSLFWTIALPITFAIAAVALLVAFYKPWVQPRLEALPLHFARGDRDKLE